MPAICIIGIVNQYNNSKQSQIKGLPFIFAQTKIIANVCHDLDTFHEAQSKYSSFEKKWNDFKQQLLQLVATTPKKRATTPLRKLFPTKREYLQYAGSICIMEIISNKM